MKFSQRIGITPPQKSSQVDSMDTDLRVSLWNAITSHRWEFFNRKPKEDETLAFLKQIWGYLNWRIDKIPSYDNAKELIAKYFLEAEWYEVYDLLEFISNINTRQINKNRLFNECNYIFEIENSAYRFVDNKLIEINSRNEIEEIERAIKQSTPYYGTKKHLETAITLLTDKKNPDYVNSIKESISAVESLCKVICNDDKATLGRALTIMEKKMHLHSALKEAFSNLYGYTSDANGIRHGRGITEKGDLTGADARFMLISCSAFINYMIASCIDK